MTYRSRPGNTLYNDALRAVTALMAQTGQTPSLSEVAEHTGIDRKELDSVFPDQERLHEAVAETALVLLHDQCIRAVVQVDHDNPVAQFEALADAYIDWAFRYPREFRIIGAMPASQFQRNDLLLRYEQSIHELMLRLLSRAKQQGQLADDEDLGLLLACAHTFAYGVISKTMLGDLPRWIPGRDAVEGARAALHLFTRKMLDHAGPATA